MLTRLQIKGFKNLVNVDVRFGPLTCVVGPNGAGKSNLFDAIQFLSTLTNNSLMEAAASVRARNGYKTDVRQLFHRMADHQAKKMSFTADMIVPATAVDSFGQEAVATTTFLRYSLELGCRRARDGLAPVTLEILKEELIHLRHGDASKHLLFPHKVDSWRKSAVRGKRQAPFISTEGHGAGRVIKLHRDGSSGRRPLPRPAAKLPRTILSSANAAERPTAAVARREMETWRILQLEPPALRQPDEFTAPASIGPDGRYLAATLHRLARGNPIRTYAQIANRLSELMGEVRVLDVDVDPKRELLTLCIKDRKGTLHPAQALSDGTLRFLALAVLQHDPEAPGVLCLEEPENSIHPTRIPAMLNLLADTAVDPMEPSGPDNPPRQVIANTHSPSVLREAPDDSVVFVKMSEMKDARGQLCQGSAFYCLPDTWRTKAEHPDVISRGDMLPYFSLAAPKETDQTGSAPQRVVDRDDVQLFLPDASPAPPANTCANNTA